MKPGVDFEAPFLMIIGPPIYGMMANLCYTLGPLYDRLFGRGRPSERLFFIGLSFSLVLTALPGLWALVAWIATLVTGRKMD